jgi:hypothetical protein
VQLFDSYIVGIVRRSHCVDDQSRFLADSCPGSALGGPWAAKAATGIIFNLAAMAHVLFAELIDDWTHLTDWPTPRNHALAMGSLDAEECRQAEAGYCNRRRAIRNVQRALIESVLLGRLSAVLSERLQTNWITHRHTSTTFFHVVCGRRLGGRRSREEIDLGLRYVHLRKTGSLGVETDRRTSSSRGGDSESA